MRARHEASSLIAMDHVLLGGLCCRLLKLLHGFADFGGLTLLQERLPVAFEGFDVRL